ncbi:MAG: hypothetical protein LBE38_07945 [Deltaproteobacteria bacterium]|nr:hypothetical protein [Deltaproteobacteria bacterium]
MTKKIKKRLLYDPNTKFLQDRLSCFGAYDNTDEYCSKCCALSLSCLIEEYGCDECDWLDEFNSTIRLVAYPFH